MKGHLTSYWKSASGATERSASIRAIEIPLIQRDYAQGRTGPAIEEIRTGFLEVLLDAVAGGESVGLDFVYGKVEGRSSVPWTANNASPPSSCSTGTSRPLLARLGPDAPWTRFSYATRPSARLFCQRLAANPFPRHWNQAIGLDHRSGVVPARVEVRPDDSVDAGDDRSIHDQLRTRCTRAWTRPLRGTRLTDEQSPAISFYLLPLDDMDLR